jgi:hypothetical protein
MASGDVAQPPDEDAGEVDLKRSRERTALRRDGDVDDRPSLLDADLIKVVSSARDWPAGDFVPNR